MAITHVGSDSGNATAASNNSITLTLPGGYQADDIAIVGIYSDQDTGTHSIGTATGYALFPAGDKLTSTGRDMHVSWWWKRLTASESNPVATNTGVTEEICAFLHVFRGADTVLDPSWTHAFDDNHPTTGGESVLPADIVTSGDAAAGLRSMFQTHDDITTLNTPSGYTAGESFTGGSADHRQYMTAYDLDLGTAGTKSAPAFGNVLNNSVSEYHMAFMVLEDLLPIHITSPTANTKLEATLTIEGDGFEAVQGAGKVELWSDVTGTTKVAQTIDDWTGDTSIDITVVQGALADGVVYLVVTNDSGDESNKLPVSIGFPPYEPWVTTEPDHFWPMNNAYTDEAARSGTNRPFNNVQTGSPDFVATPITRTNTHSFRINAAVESSELADSIYTNVTNTHGARNIGGFVRFENLQETPAIIYEEGGGVNNIYILLLPNGRLCANVADSNGAPDFKAQAFSDFSLATGRAYHIMVEVHMANEIALWIDGIKQSSPTAGAMGTDTTMSTHSGDWVFGDPDGSLDTGGVDIAYNAAPTTLYAQWGTWSDTGNPGTMPLTEAIIRDSLFRDGALAATSIGPDTEANMQLDIDDDDDTTLADAALVYDISAPSVGSDLELTITNQVFLDRHKLHFRWLGSGELTIRNSGTSNAELSKMYAPGGGTLVLIETAPITVTVRDIVSGDVVQGAQVLLEAGATGPLTEGDQILKEETNASGQVTTEIDYSTDQSIEGRVRKGSAATYYKTGPISASVRSTGLDLTVFLIRDQ